ncbi:cytochrome c biogenesis protein CcsA [Aneurinibacillus terranovensis]|uniref:cytochrome c biogenesis protein CcsA n=1 Tax=Aneurinibacillus terranovensis TaxID=278991 RepID=UPI00041B1912|nr:cytochrome c biogenesis protein CcsA [Aneurinibacillus terranovensis]
MNLIELSSNLLLIAFILYALSMIVFFVSITGRRFGQRDPEAHMKKFGKIGYIFALIGVIFHAVFIGLRWYIGGHIPTSNMFEFMQFLAFAITLAFLVIFPLYSIPLIGAFVMPFVVLILAYASVFSREITPLVPALQSYWLQIHVTTAALGEGAFAIGFAAGLMYLLRTVNLKENSKSARWLEFVMWGILCLVSFVVLTFGFKAANYEAVFKAKVDIMGTPTDTTISYDLPAIAGPQNGTLLTQGKMQPVFETPSFMKGQNAAHKLNTVIWSMLGGTILYVLLRLALRKRLALPLSRWVQDLDAPLVDEISYRAIAIGFPIFTLGALIFAMIWAAEAWGHFWSWDPKEVWALVTWLFYSAYLHLRLSRGWVGQKSAWMAVIGFIIVMFNLVFVNMVIAGLHSYA